MPARARRSLRASEPGIKRLREVMLGFGRLDDMAAASSISLSTLKNLLAGKPVDRGIFHQLCEKLELDWQDIADLEVCEPVDVEAAVALADTLCAAGTGKNLDALQKAVLRGGLAGKSYQQIAIDCSCSESHIKNVGSQLCEVLSEVLGEKVSKMNLQSALDRRIRHSPGPAENLPAKRAAANSFALPEKIAPVRDWVGRSRELNSLKSLILGAGSQEHGTAVSLPRPYKKSALHPIDNSYLTAVNIVGLAGIGKTALASQLVRQLQAENAPFALSAWETLRSPADTPPRFDNVIDSLLLALSGGEITPDVTIRDDSRQKIDRLIELLKQKPCLLVLDNVETVLQTKEAERAGFFAKDCAEYAWLFEQIVKTEHQSKAIFTSWETLTALSGREIYTFRLGGLDRESACDFLESFNLTAAPEELAQLAERYGEHPKSLEAVAVLIRDDSQFQGNASKFLKTVSKLLVNTLDELIERVIQRLSEEELNYLTQISLNEKPLLVDGRSAQMPETSDLDTKAKAIVALKRRQLIENGDNSDACEIHPLVREKAARKGAIAANNRGVKFYIAGDLIGGRKQFELAIKINSDNAASYYNLGLVYEQVLDSDRAIELYQEAALRGFAAAYCNLARLYIIKDRDWAKAVEKTWQGLKLIENEKVEDDKIVKAALLTYLAWAWKEQGRWEEALEKLLLAVKLESDRGLTYGIMAEVLENQGNKAEALAAWKNCLEYGNSDRLEEEIWIAKARWRLKEG